MESVPPTRRRKLSKYPPPNLQPYIPENGMARPWNMVALHSKLKSFPESFEYPRSQIELSFLLSILHLLVEESEGGGGISYYCQMQNKQLRIGFTLMILLAASLSFLLFVSFEKGGLNGYIKLSCSFDFFGFSIIFVLF